MALNATLLADFSSFMSATKEAVSAMEGFKLTAEELGPSADRGLAVTQQQAEQLGRSLNRLGTDALAASQTFIDAFAEEQEAVGRLTSALETIGQATPQVVTAYAQMASEFQNTTKYADEAITDVQAVLTTIGKVGPDQMQLALTATTNLASAMKIDLATAANMVAKAIGSGGESLGKLKTVLGDTIQPGQSTAEMLQAINDKMGPAAQNELQTYNGQIANLKNQMSDFQEMIGKVLVENLQALLSAFQSLPEPVQKFTVGVVAIGTALAPVLVSLSSLVSILATPGIGAAMMSALTAIVTLLTGPVGIAIAVAAVATAVALNWDKISAYTQQLYEGIKTWLVDKLAGVWNTVQQKLAEMVAYFQRAYQSLVGGSIVPDILDGIQTQFGRLDAVMVGPARAATEQVVSDYAKMMAYTARANAIWRQTPGVMTLSEHQQIADAAERIFLGGGGGGGGGGGAITMHNTFNINGSGQDIARIVLDEITKLMRSGRKFPSA